MPKKLTGYEYHSQFFQMEVTLPTTQDVEEIVRQVLEELKDFHPKSIVPTSVVMNEVMRRVRDKVSGTFAVKPEWIDALSSR
ncbi:hypothetical protein [Pantoea ananatis]|uniref:hypothetical protein n=1 Tax=Pantoea ananas TaxID=553 RepID=UPI000FEC814F|nr:hypothetical protein [Pantoea ananatis]QAB30908.1 hypothetical protein EPK90_14470 [Pantoea ananatis]